MKPNHDKPPAGYAPCTRERGHEGPCALPFAASPPTEVPGRSDISNTTTPSRLSDALDALLLGYSEAVACGANNTTDEANYHAARTAIVALFADVEGERNGWKAIAESNRDAYTEIVEAGRKGFMSKEWCLAMSEVEGTSEVGAGREVGSRKKAECERGAALPRPMPPNEK